MSGLEQATSLDALLAATCKAACGKRHRPEIARFLMDAEPECLSLQRGLRLPIDHPEAWWPGPRRAFSIRDPKPRIITVVPFRDRVVQHALCAVIEPALDRASIHHSYACRLGRGQHRALRYAQRLARARPWVLKCDIAAYFASIRHDRVLELLRRRVRDDDLCDRVARVLAGPRPGVSQAGARGLVIGSLVSQHLANLYLSVVDHWLTDGLGYRHYLRYMDDFLVFAERQQLDPLRDRIDRFLRDRLDLSLNERRTGILPVRDGVPFLGFRVFPGMVRPSGERWRRFRRRHRAAERALEAGEIGEEAAALSMASQFAHLAAFDTYRARVAHLARLDEELDRGRWWRQPGHPRRLLEQRSAERAGRQPQQERAVQPQPEPGLSPRELSGKAERPSLGLFAGSVESTSRSALLHPAADQTLIPCPTTPVPSPLRRGAESAGPGGGAPCVAVGAITSVPR